MSKQKREIKVNKEKGTKSPKWMWKKWNKSNSKQYFKYLGDISFFFKKAGGEINHNCKIKTSFEKLSSSQECS